LFVVVEGVFFLFLSNVCLFDLLSVVCGCFFSLSFLLLSGDGELGCFSGVGSLEIERGWEITKKKQETAN